MYLTKRFKPADDGDPRAVKNRHGDMVVVSYIRVDNATDVGHWKTQRVQAGAAEGWLSLGDGKITIKTAPDLDDLVYVIHRGPGHYCCECGIALDGQHPARQHVLLEHTGVEGKDAKAIAGMSDEELRKVYHDFLEAQGFEPSDKQNPSGYCRHNYYDCRKE